MKKRMKKQVNEKKLPQLSQRINTISEYSKIRITVRVRVRVCYDTLLLMILYKHRSRSDPPRVSSPSVAYTCMQFNGIQLHSVQCDEL